MIRVVVGCIYAAVCSFRCNYGAMKHDTVCSKAYAAGTATEHDATPGATRSTRGGEARRAQAAVGKGTLYRMWDVAVAWNWNRLPAATGASAGGFRSADVQTSNVMN